MKVFKVEIQDRFIKENTKNLKLVDFIIQSPSGRVYHVCPMADNVKYYEIWFIDKNGKGWVIGNFLDRGDVLLYISEFENVFLNIGND